jgi:hypothetical protein
MRLEFAPECKLISVHECVADFWSCTLRKICGVIQILLGYFIGAVMLVRKNNDVTLCNIM